MSYVQKSTGLKAFFYSVLVALSLSLPGCASDYGPKQVGGALIGGAGGAALGSQIGDGTTRTVSTAVGTLLGAGLGMEVGSSLDRADYCYRYGC